MAILRSGSEGEEVARLQALLCLADIDARPIDGDFGPGTERAVHAYQDSKGLPSTGEVDEGMQETLGMNLADETGLISLRSREFRMRLLDRQRILKESDQWKVINTLLPVLLVIGFGAGVGLYRRKIYR